MKTINFEVNDGGEVIKLTVNQPNYNAIEEADKVYASKIASLIRENGKRKLLLRTEIDKFLKDNGIWTSEDDKAVENLNKDIDTILTKIRKGGLRLSEGRELCIQAMDKRKEIFRTMNKRRVFDDSTIESVAETERMDYLIFVSTLSTDTNEQYWLSFDDMKNDKSSQVYSDSSAKLYEIVYGTSGEFEKGLPENKWLKKYNFIDEELNYVDRKSGEKVDRNGVLIKNIEEEVRKQFDNLNGDIVEEVPFVDDETNEPVKV